jgi:long-chain acyl-CoA synthetase
LNAAAAFAASHAFRATPFQRDLGRFATVAEAIEARSHLSPGSPYLTAVGPHSELRTVTFRDLDVLSAAAAHWVRRDLGVKPGEVVGLIPTNDLPSVVMLFGIVRSGAICLMLGPGDPAARIAEQAASQAAIVIVRSTVIATDHSALQTVSLPEFHHASPVASGLVPRDAAAAMLLFGTSGSTAASKVVLQSHRNAATNAEAVIRHHRLAAGQRILTFLPIHHVNAVHFTLFASLFAGAHAILVHAFDPLEAPKVIERLKPRIASVVPSILEALTQTWREPLVPDGFEYFLSAAAPLTSATVREVRRLLGRRVVQGYGLTETTNFTTTVPIDLTEARYDKLMEHTDLPPVGIALYGNEVSIRRPDLTLCDPGEVGEVCIRGHNVMMGYAGNVEATNHEFRGGWFHSGDLGKHLASPLPGGSVLQLVGRLKNVAKVRGEAVSLDELERVLRAVPGVRDAVCWTTPHRFLGEEITAGVVFADQAFDILSALRVSLSANALPARVVSIPAVPRSPTGKIVRPGLHALFPADQA